MIWAQIRSWHVVNPSRESRGGGRYAMCGRYLGVNPATLPDLPMTEKSCETCARLQLHSEAKG